MDLGIAGRKAIVCASSKGLGKGCARALAEAGCEVVMNGRNEVLEVKIDPSAMSDVKLLEDLVRAAMNAAVANLQAEAKSKMGLMAQNLGIGPLGSF